MSTKNGEVDISKSDPEYKKEQLQKMHYKEIVKQSLENCVVGAESAPEFPSDFDPSRRFQRMPESNAYRPNVDPETTSIILFPGQGSQFIGMGKSLLAYPNVKDLYENANELLGYDLLNVCLNGPKEKLDSTRYCQPSVLVTSLAAVEKLKEESPKAFDLVVGVAGFSVGEYAALVFGGVLTFEDAVRLVKVRAENMQMASESIQGGLLSVFIDPQTQLRNAMVAAREFCRQKAGIEEPVCAVANHLCHNLKVVGGNEEALQFLQQYGREWGIKRTKRLPVSGAFHTQLMHPDFFSKFHKQLDKTPMEEPSLPIHSNVDGKQYHTVSQIKNHLRRQIRAPVLWEQTMHIFYKRAQNMAFPQTYEVGPSRQLGHFLKEVNNKAYKNYNSVSV